MINITTESNQSFTSEFEMEEKVSPDFSLLWQLIILSREEEKIEL